MSKWDTTGLDENKKPRLDYKNRDQLSNELKDIFDSIVSVSYTHLRAHET